MLVDTHVHVIAPDEARYPLRPSGVGSQWFREHPVSVEEYVDHRERRWRRPRGAGAGRTARTAPTTRTSSTRLHPTAVS